MSCRDFARRSFSHMASSQHVSWRKLTPLWQTKNLNSGFSESTQDWLTAVRPTPHTYQTEDVDFPLQLWNPHLAQEDQLPPPCLPLHMAASCVSRSGWTGNGAKTAHQRLAGKCALLLPGSGLNCVLFGLYEINHGKRIGGVLLWKTKTVFPALSNPIKLVRSRQVVDDETSFRGFLLLSFYDCHWKVKESWSNS